jgi:hypothetical protein
VQKGTPKMVIVVFLFFLYSQYLNGVDRQHDSIRINTTEEEEKKGFEKREKKKEK